MNLGDAFKRPMSDPEWIKKCGMAGLMVLIPIVGTFAVLGWSIRYYEGLGQGETNLPDPFGDVGGDIVRGFKLAISIMISLLPLLLAFTCAGLMPVIFSAIDNDLAPVGALLSLLIILPSALIAAAITPAAEIAHLSTGNVVAFSAMGPVLSRAKSSIGNYAMLVVGMVVAGIVGQLGVIACFVGLIVTLPLSFAMRMSLVNAWQSDG